MMWTLDLAAMPLRRLQSRRSLLLMDSIIRVCLKQKYILGSMFSNKRTVRWSMALLRVW